MKDFTVYINEKLTVTKTMLKQNYDKYHPKTKDELVETIKEEVENNGWECDLNHIDVSKITDMSYLFSANSAGYGLGDLPGYNLEKFNGDISRWNVSSVKNMSHMFYGAKSFNKPIEDWDVSNVENMDYMFFSAESFNQPIGDWEVSNVTDTQNMFHWAESFNQPIGDWDVSNVNNMKWMFSHAESFNQDLSKWKIKHGCDTDNMFVECRSMKKEFKPKGI